jgi:hypothetical protein
MQRECINHEIILKHSNICKKGNFAKNRPGFEAEIARLTKLTFSTLSTETWASLSDPKRVIAFSLTS